MKVQIKVRDLYELWNTHDLRSIVYHGKCKFN